MLHTQRCQVSYLAFNTSPNKKKFIHRHSAQLNTAFFGNQFFYISQAESNKVMQSITEPITVHAYYY